MALCTSVILDNMNLDIVKEQIKSNLGKKVVVKIYGMRNRVETIEGIITKVYPNLFMVENSRESKSISYSEIITKEAVVKYL